MNESINCILVTPHGRSGSLFIQSLFDGHHQVVSLPGLGMSYSFPHSIFDVIAALDEFIRKHPDVFDSSNSYLGIPGERVTCLFGPDQNQHLYVDSMEFRRNALHDEFDSWVKEERPISRKDFVIGVHKAFARTIGQNPSEIKYILIHAHSYDGSHDRALDDFPDLFYVAMARDPREDWLSWDKVCALRTGAGYTKISILMRNNSIRLYADSVHKLYLFSLKLHPGQLRIIDLNRFHELNREAMVSLAGYFGIEFQDILLESTFLRKLWWGNSADRIPISGFDSKKIPYNWTTKLSKEDEAAISSALMEPIRMLNYPTGTYSSVFVLRTPCKPIVDMFIRTLVSSIRNVANRNQYNNKILRRIPLVIAKTVHISYEIYSNTVELAKSLYGRNKQPNYDALKGRMFDPADFL